MGGAAGHMNHLYDNPELSFDEMFSIMKSASRGKLQGTEKLDGVNVFLGFNAGVAKAARNENDIAKGGKDLEAILARDFKGGDKIKQVYANAVKAFNLAVESLSDEERIQIFGENGQKFYNAEILHSDAKNIVSYSEDVVSIHRQGHKELNAETGKVEEFDAGSTADALDQAINKFEIQLSDKNTSYKFRRAAIENLKELSNKEDLQIAMAKINKALGGAGVGSGDTVGAYLKAVISKQLTEIPEEYLDIATRRMTGGLAWRSPEINGLPKDVKKTLSQYWKQAKPMLEKAIYPIEEAVHEFSVAMLEGLESAFIIDNSAEVENIRKQVSQAKKQIESYVSQGLPGSEKANQILVKQLAKLKDVENITTASEGFVFEHEGVLYKFTGNFAPINQIVNLYKWGRGKQVPPISQQLEDTPEEELQEVEAPLGDLARVAIVPGGFKPPHAGHFQGAEWFLNGKKKDEENNVIEPADVVYVLISPKSRMGHSKDGRDGRGVEITKEMSKQLWDLYIKENGLGGKMKAIVVKEASPVKAAYEFMTQLRPGQTLLLGCGAKDACDNRFMQAQAWSDKNGYELNVEIVNTPMMAGGVSGTDMRRSIADGNYEEFAKYIPLKDPAQAWQIVRPDTEPQTKPQPEEVAESFMPFLQGVIRELIAEKAKSKAQQRFMGMVHACKEEGDCPSAKVKKAADSMKDKDTEDYASTKHKGLPAKMKEGSIEPVPPYHGGRDDRLLDQTPEHVLWQIKYGSKNYWLITDYAGQMIDPYGTGFSKKRDAMAAWGSFKNKSQQETGELEEISAMSAGSVEGAAGSTTRKNKKSYNAWQQSDLAQEVIKEFKADDSDVIDLDYGLQLSRAELPQIKSTDVPEFMQWLGEEHGVVTEEDTINPSVLTPIQKEINLEKVAGMVANKGLEALATSKPVMVSGDDYLIDGHHRWYALLDAEYPSIDVVRVGMTAKELIPLMKTWDKASFKSTVQEELYEYVLNYLKEEQSYENFSGEKFVLDLQDMSVVPTKHGEERRLRHKQGAGGMKISKGSIVKAIEKAMGNVMNDFMNGELQNDEAFLIRAKQGSQPTLNIVCALKMKKGPDSVNIITVMRKEDFKTDNFNAQKEYGVSI